MPPGTILLHGSLCARSILEIMKLVVKFGGSILSHDLIKRYSDIFSKLAQHHSIWIVVGGGELARQNITIARELGANEYLCDQIGILSSRLNSMLLLAAIRRYLPAKFIQDYSELESAQIAVAGGMVPGQSTDAVAALIAEATNADLMIKLSDVDGIYSGDPKLDPNAFKYSKLSYDQLIQLSMTQIRPGSYGILDPVAARILQRSCIPLILIDGRDPGNLERVLKGEELGTKVT